MEGFELKCLKCGETDISCIADVDYGYDGEDEYSFINGYYLECNNCGNCEDII